MKIKLLIVFILFLNIFSSCSNKKPTGIVFNKADSTFLTYEVFKINSGWGYIIYKSGIVFIYQDFIPAINHKIPFDSYDKAEKTAKFVVQIMQQSSGLPFVTFEQLDSLKVLNEQIIKNHYTNN